jgi:FKBP-type peptidyl-prolyl cis-trans isomerase FklB
VSRGVADALAGTAPLLAPDDMRRTLLELKRKIKSREIAEGRKQQAEEHAKDEAFLAENAKKEGVVVLPSGLQYKILKAGSGRQPAPGDQVTVSYRASLTSGVEFDRTPEGQPVSFAVDEVIPGWREGLRRMHEGAHWQLFVPSSLGYGVRGPLANRAVILDVELVEVGANGEATAVQAPSGEPQKK